MADTAHDLFQAGDIAGWTAALTAEVKAAPTDVSKRFQLGEALLVAGNVDRADAQFDMVSTQDPSWGPKAAMIRQMLRAMKAREEFFTKGSPPEILKDPDDYLSTLLRANMSLREGDEAEAAKLFAEAEELRPEAPGTAGDKAFDDFRDLDDRTAGILEIVTSNGKYYWTPYSQVREIAFAPVERPRDIVLRQAEVDIVDGPSGVVFIPTIYWMDPGKSADAARLGRITDWLGDDDGGPMYGVGQRAFLIGEEAAAIHTLEHLTFNVG